MKVVISCGGKFHAFHLAEQLNKRGYLHRLLTTYYSIKDWWLPKSRNDKEKIDLIKVRTNILPEIIGRGFGQFPFIRNLTNWNYYSLQLFDGWAREQVDRCDILVAWSGMALHTIRRAKSYGAMTIVERGSSHILYQKEILEEEYEKYGIRIKPVDGRIVEKELIEYSEADYISIPSNFVKKTFLEKGFVNEKLIHVPYGVDLSSFKKIPKEDDIFRVIFVGGLTLRKGIHYLLQAFAELNLQNSELLLIGSISPEIKPFLKECQEGCSYFGKMPHLELYKQFSQGSVFVMPSIEEGLAMVIPQAMACGLPVICTINTGGSDIIREGKEGFIVPIRDVEALKEKITYLYDHENERKAMSEMAVRRAREFTWDHYGEKIIKEYALVLERK